MMETSRPHAISKDPKLQEDIERNLKLRDGASRILAVAANTIQRLDAAKTIIVSNSRLVVSMQQLQREKMNEANAAAAASHGDQGLSPPTTSSKHFCTGAATLCLSGIRIPLLWKDTSLTPNASSTLNRLLDPGYHWASANLSGYSSFTVGRQQRPLSAVLSMATIGAIAGGEALAEVCSAFCIVRVGDQIRETRLLCEIYPGSADLEFDDVLTFENVQPDFECSIEIYGYQSSNGQGTNSFLRRKSQMDSTSPANRNSIFLGTLTPEYAKDSKTGQRISISSNSPATDCCFTLVARYSAKLADLGERVNAHPLELLSSHSHSSSLYSSSSGINFPFSSASALPTSEDVLPLFGPICFTLTALPDSVQRPVLSGLLWLRKLNVSSKPETAKLYFCELRNQRLYARLIKPNERTKLSLKSDREDTDELMGEVRLRSSSSKAVRRPPHKWDILIKVDPSTEILDKEPVCRSMPISLKALTWEERENILFKSERLPRRFLSADPLPSLQASGKGAISSVRDCNSDYRKGNFRSPAARIRSLEGIQVATSAFLERQMATLNVISRLCDEDDRVVVEVAAFDSYFFTNTNESEGSALLSDWLFAMREHIEEQVKWGVEAFGHEVYIPEATSLTKHGTVIRASTIPDIPAASLEPLSSPIAEEASTLPITEFIDLGIGGAERAVVDAAMAAKCAGYEVEIITNFHDAKHAFEETVNGSLKITSVCHWLPRSIMGRFVALCAFVKMFLASVWIVFARRKLVDLVFVDQVSVPLLVLKLVGIKTIFFGHFPDLLLSSHDSWVRKAYRYPLDLLEEFSTGMADTLVVNSQFTGAVFKQTFRRLKNRELKVLYPVPNTDNLVLPREICENSSNASYHLPNAEVALQSLQKVLGVRPKLMFLSINRYERKKNIQLAFESFAVLKEAWSELVKGSLLSPSDVYIVHAGGYDVRVRENVEHFDELKQLLKDLKISEQAVLLRSVPSSTKSLLIAASSALIYTPAFEHFGIVPIEAMYLGRPVIAIDSGGPRETIVHQKTGFLCPAPGGNASDNAETAARIAKYMCKFINDPKLTRIMGKHSHAHVLRKFSTKAFQKKLCCIIEHTLRL
ncbi:Alpha-13/16-mannosyltransferase ALG2 [Taenia crassiceps]|uniref:GDP-Man:Man(1)GlcNAc(2)-PP-Dol alpha-1,3-mannosyltransferase n=1 Tax=Taenia crassiceps TaxID=6207 RepID=A0ABR4QKP3_9CEST